MKTKHVIELIGIGAAFAGSVIAAYLTGQDSGASNIADQIVNQIGDNQTGDNQIYNIIGGSVNDISPDEVAQAVVEQLKKNQEDITQIKEENQEAQSKISELEEENESLSNNDCNK